MTQIPATIDTTVPVFGTARWLAEYLERNQIRLVQRGAEVRLVNPVHRTGRGEINPLSSRIAWLEEGRVLTTTTSEHTVDDQLPLPGTGRPVYSEDLQSEAQAAYLELEKQARLLLEARLAEDDAYVVSIGIQRLTGKETK